MNKQQKEVQQAFLDNEKEVLKKLEENYQDALFEIDDRLAKLLGRDDADMQNVVYQMEYQKALKAQVQGILDQLHSNSFETVSDYLSKSYEEGFLGTMYDLQGQGIPLVIPINQEQVVAAIQHETKLSSGLYEALGKDTSRLSRQIAGEISRGISNAATYSEMARNIESFCNIPKNNAARIARTEAHRIQCKATADAQWKAKEKGADVVKQWDSTLDDKTRPTHRELNGQIRELDQPFTVEGKTAMQPGDFGDPSEDCNCRCALLQRARWALEADIATTKWDASAPEVIAQDGSGTRYVDISDAKNYEEFKKNYDEVLKYQEPLENNGESSTIKSITVDDIEKAIEGASIKTEVAYETASVLKKYNALNIFDSVVSENKNDKSVLNTIPEKNGTFFDITFGFNEATIGGKSIEEINQMFSNAKNTVANSFEDAIVHEIYHAKLISGLNYAQLENLYDELDAIHIIGFSNEAYKSGAECISEVGVMIERGEKDKVPEAAMNLFVKYMGEVNGN